MKQYVVAAVGIALLAVAAVALTTALGVPEHWKSALVGAVAGGGAVLMMRWVKRTPR